MDFLDLRTVISLSGVMGGLMSLVMLALRRNYPSSIHGLGEWAAALAMMFVAGVLAAKRDSIHQLLAINLASALLWYGDYVAYVGSRRFFGQPVRHAPWVGGIGLVLAAQVWFTLAMPDYRVRLVLTTVTTGCILAFHAWLIACQRPVTLAKGLALVVQVVLVLLQVMRLVTAFTHDARADFFANDPVQVIYLTGLTFAVLLFAISMVLMASDRVHDELEHLASHDSLTNALTRRHLTMACRAELERCRRNGGSMALLMMDLDHFKAINDTHGHQAGDAVLVRFVVRVKSVLRPSDQLGRFGGEEFVALLPESTLHEAQVVAERIRELAQAGTTDLACTVSIGIAVSDPSDESIDRMLARADMALYLAKARGRNRIECARTAEPAHPGRIGIAALP